AAAILGRHGLESLRREHHPRSDSGVLQISRRLIHFVTGIPYPARSGDAAPDATVLTTMIAITHVPSPAMESGERQFLRRGGIHHILGEKEQQAYCKLLADCGATVVALNVNRELPDCAFVEDAAVLLDEIAVLTTMGAASRRPELPGIAAEL